MIILKATIPYGGDFCLWVSFFQGGGQVDVVLGFFVFFFLPILCFLIDSVFLSSGAGYNIRGTDILGTVYKNVDTSKPGPTRSTLHGKLSGTQLQQSAYV